VRSAAGGASGKRVLGKAVVKGGLLLKGKNPGNVGRVEFFLSTTLSFFRFSARRTIFAQGSQLPRTTSEKPFLTLKLCVKNTSTSNSHEFSGYVCYRFLTSSNLNAVSSPWRNVQTKLT
jgi:hypothetical protein